MQIDSHYYATFALARAAGLRPDVAQTIATCAQFVDDNVAQVSIELQDGSRVDAEATAHHTVATENLEVQDQRQVWVPFHFLPGNQGATFSERLKCRKNSEVAREMVAHHLGRAKEPYAASLLGIAAHVYGDTFSHYGFAGVSSRGNRVVNDSFRFSDDLDPEILEYITKKQEKFRFRPAAKLLTNFKSWLGEEASGALGHGAVATFPDRPYLAWSFEYESADAEHGKHSERDNRITFVEGFELLHAMFREFAVRRPEHDAGDGRRFSDILATVKEVVDVQAPCDGRIAAWQEAARLGRVFEGDSIPEYQGWDWNGRWAELDKTPSSEAVHDHEVWRFYQAAAIHRTYVLRDLLPSKGLIVD